MPRALARPVLLAGMVSVALAQTAHAQAPVAKLEPPRITAPRVVEPLDQEMWAGVSYRQALAGLAILGGGAAVVTWLTGSSITGITAAVTLAAAYVVYDPGVTGVRSPSDLPTLPELGVKGNANGGD
jgi:hypothetical protein